MEWFISNKEWLLSGIAVAIPIALIGWFFIKRGNAQKQRGGKDSTNIQVGGDLSINLRQGKDNE